MPEYSQIVDKSARRLIKKEKFLEKTKILKLKDKSTANIEADIEAIQNGEYISKIDKYFNEFYEKKSSF